MQNVVYKTELCLAALSCEKLGFAFASVDVVLVLALKFVLVMDIPADSEDWEEYA